jgi:cholesterol transport system auxiliary component
MTSSLFRRLLLPVAALALAGCSSVIGLGNRDPVDVYRLAALEAPVTPPPAPQWRLLVELPLASGGLDTNRIAIKTGPLEVKYLADTRWAQRLPLMMQSILVDSFEAGSGALALDAEGAANFAPYALETEIRDFEADVSTKGAPRVTLRFALRLKTTSPARIVDSTTLTATADATGDTAQALTTAFNTALQTILGDTVRWTATHIPATPPARP